MNPITRECQDCPNLQELLSDIDCTILNLSQSKYNSIVYGVAGCCNPTLLQTLLAYKRIITARTYNPHYPCSLYTSNELLSKARLLAYKTNCSRCPECEEVITPSTTLPPPPGGECYSYLVYPGPQTQTEPIQYPYSYINCEGALVTGTINQYQTLNICAIRYSIVINPILFIISEYAPGCGPVPEPCLCVEITNEEEDQGVVPYVFSYSDCDDNDYEDVELDYGDSMFICLKRSTITTNFKFSLVLGDECTHECPITTTTTIP